MSAVGEAAPAENWKTIDKRHFVMANALELLVDVGYQGLTMRGLADRSKMTLSNVQYYFRSKENLIAEIADLYFDDCNRVLLAHFEEYGPIHDRPGLEKLVAVVLEHGRTMSEMCRVFRELWAIGSRNEDLAARIDHHYRQLGETLGSHIRFAQASQEARNALVLVFLTVSEGYSIVGPAQIVSHDHALTLFTDILYRTTLGE